MDLTLKLYCCLIISCKFVCTSSQDSDLGSCENVTMPTSITLQSDGHSLAIEGLTCNKTDNEEYKFYFTCLSDWCKGKQWTKEVLMSTLGANCTLQLPEDLMSFTEYELKTLSGGCNKTYSAFKTPPERPLRVTNVKILCLRNETLGLKFKEPTRPTGNLSEFTISYGFGRGRIKSEKLQSTTDLNEYEVCLKNLIHNAVYQFTISALNMGVPEAGEPYTFAKRIREDATIDNYCKACDGIDTEVARLLSQLKNNTFNDIVNATCSSKTCYVNLFYLKKIIEPSPSPCTCGNPSNFVNCMNGCIRKTYLAANETRKIFLLVGQNRITDEQAIGIYQEHQRDETCVELSKFEERHLNKGILLYELDPPNSLQWVCTGSERGNANSLSRGNLPILRIICISLFFFMYQRM